MRDGPAIRTHSIACPKRQVAAFLGSGGARTFRGGGASCQARVNCGALSGSCPAVGGGGGVTVGHLASDLYGTPLRPFSAMAPPKMGTFATGPQGVPGNRGAPRGQTRRAGEGVAHVPHGVRMWPRMPRSCLQICQMIICMTSSVQWAAAALLLATISLAVHTHTQTPCHGNEHNPTGDMLQGGSPAFCQVRVMQHDSHTARAVQNQRRRCARGATLRARAR